MGVLAIFTAGASSFKVLPRTGIPGWLVSAINAGVDSKAITKTLKSISQFKPKYTILDSGGYQIYEYERTKKPFTFDPNKPLCANGTLNISPKHVAEVAGKIKPHIVMGLDYPIAKLNDPQEQNQEYLRKRCYNQQWAMETSIYLNMYCPSARYFIPIQCYTTAQFKQFYSVVRVVSHHGVSMPTRNMNVDLLTDFFLEFHKHGIKRVHLLGVESFSAIALCAYASNYLFDWVSTDAQSLRINAEYDKYYHPATLKPILISKIAQNPSLVSSCNCSWCKQQNGLPLWDLPRTNRMTYLACHNSWTVEQVSKILFRHASSQHNFIPALNQAYLDFHKQIKQLEACCKRIKDYLANPT